MDSLITAAARALAAGDPLGALKRVALRDDAPALALRGIALEQLEMPAGVGVSGLESDGGDRFFCGGGGSGKVRAVPRPRRASAPRSRS